MGRFLNPDYSAFETALNSEIYIDKTGLLAYTNKVINTKQAFICNSRPRRFGKSVTADMLTAYYSKGCDSADIFADYEISHAGDFRQHLNKYDVIHLDIQWCLAPAKGAAGVVSYIEKSVIAELKEKYPNIISEETVSLPEAMSEIYTVTGNKFIVIIDEWDILIRDEANNRDEQENYINFLRGMFKGTEPTRFISLAYLTGILPIKKMKTQSALNNFDEFTMLDAGALASYIGFTELEVEKLCDKYHKDFAEVKRWYDGYVLENQQVYNPKAVVSVMLRGNFQSYWSQTGTYEVVVPLINMDFDGLKQAIIEMVSGSTVEVDTGTFQNDTVSFSSRDDVITYLIHLGYLAYDQRKQCAFIPKDEYYQAQKAIRNVTPIQYKVDDDFALKGKICCGNCNRQLRHERQYGEMVFYCGYKRSAGKFSKCYGGYYREYSVNAKVARAIKTVFYALDVVNQGMQEKQSVIT